jgi:hypothetical protein
MSDESGRTSRSLLLITGTMGAGKSTVMAEASDLLAMRHIEHAAIDMDALGLAYLSPAMKNDEVMYANLACVAENYARRGVRRFLVARAVEGQSQLDRCREAVSADHIVICRLTAGLATLQQRVNMRETGMLQAEFVLRAEELNAILDRAHLEDFTIANEDRPVTEVAREVLIGAGWVSD